MNPADWIGFLKGNRTVIVAWITAGAAALGSLNAVYHWFNPEILPIAVTFLTAVGLMTARSGTTAVEQFVSDKAHQVDRDMTDLKRVVNVASLESQSAINKANAALNKVGNGGRTNA